MDIRVLRYYLAVCQEGTMSRAAEVLHVTQPTLSRQIADLERELGCTLLVRGSRQVVPTEQGLYLQRRASEIVGLADQTTADLKSDEGVVEGTVSIGAGETQGMRVVAAVIRELREQYPHVRFRMHSGHAADVIERLENGLIDFAVLIDYSSIDRYEHMRLRATDAWGLLMPEDHPLAAKETIAPEDLAGMRLMASSQALKRDTLSSWFGEALDSIDIVLSYNLFFNAEMMVRERVGCALTLDGLSVTGEGTGLAYRLLYPPVVSPIDIAWKRNQVFTNAGRKFLEALRASSAIRPQ